MMLPYYDNIMPAVNESIQAAPAQEYFKERRAEVEAVAKQFEIAIECESRSGYPAKTIVTAADEELLLTKADLVTESERKEIAEFIRTELLKEFGSKFPNDILNGTG
jgi:hypothetical protein